LLNEIPNILNQGRLDKWSDYFLTSINIVDRFYLQKFNEIKQQYKKLKSNLEKLEKIRKKYKDNLERKYLERINIGNIMDDQEVNGVSGVNNMHNSINNYDDVDKNIMDRETLYTFKIEAKDELMYASSWMRATSDLYISTSWLEGFSNINEIASRVLIQKISTLILGDDAHIPGKSINHTSGHVGHPAYSKELIRKLEEKSFFYKKGELEDFKQKLKKFYADKFTDRNLALAEAEFDERLCGQNNLKDYFVFYFCVGVIIAIFVLLPVTIFIPNGN